MSLQLIAEGIPQYQQCIGSVTRTRYDVTVRRLLPDVGKPTTKQRARNQRRFELQPIDEPNARHGVVLERTVRNDTVIGLLVQPRECILFGSSQIDRRSGIS